MILLLPSWIFFFAHALKHLFRADVFMSLEISGKAVFPTVLASDLAVLLIVLFSAPKLYLLATSVTSDESCDAFGLQVFR